MKTYSPTLREKMLEKMLAPNAKSIAELANECGIAKSTLSTWKSRAVKEGGMNTSNRSRRPDDWSFEEKVGALAEASNLSDSELGIFLRKKGLHEADLQRWRELIAAALAKPGSKKKLGKNTDAKRIKELERELRRKDKALAEAAALLVLKKKVQAIWGDGDDDTTGGSGK